MYREIDPFNYSAEILKALKKGVLLTSKKGDVCNTMSIAWGQIGIEWNVPVFTAFVRTGRYTHGLLESGEFSINVPYGSENVGKIIGYAGSKSGRDTDKISDLGLTVIDGRMISIPGIKEFPLTLECRVVYRQEQELEAIDGHYRSRHYPADVTSDYPGSNMDCHTMFYGEIVGAHIIEE